MTVEVNGEAITLGYEISRLREYEFDLVVWYRGTPLKDRVRQEQFNPHNDVPIYAQMLVERHLKSGANG